MKQKGGRVRRKERGERRVKKEEENKERKEEIAYISVFVRRPSWELFV